MYSPHECGSHYSFYIHRSILFYNIKLVTLQSFSVQKFTLHCLIYLFTRYVIGMFLFDQIGLNNNKLILVCINNFSPERISSQSSRVSLGYLAFINCRLSMLNMPKK